MATKRRTYNALISLWRLHFILFFFSFSLMFIFFSFCPFFSSRIVSSLRWPPFSGSCSFFLTLYFRRILKSTISLHYSWFFACNSWSEEAIILHHDHCGHDHRSLELNDPSSQLFSALLGFGVFLTRVWDISQALYSNDFRLFLVIGNKACDFLAIFRILYVTQKDPLMTCSLKSFFSLM